MPRPQQAAWYMPHNFLRVLYNVRNYRLKLLHIPLSIQTLLLIFRYTMLPQLCADGHEPTQEIPC